MAILSSDKLVVVKAFAPGNPLPLDAREIYESLAEARSYAATSAVAYAGQTIKVVEGGVVTAYNLAPSTVEGENFALQFAGGGDGGIQSIGTSNVEGNVTVVAVNGENTTTKDVPVVGALVKPVVNEETHTLTLTKLGATVDENEDIVISLGGASPDTIISGVAVASDGVSLDVTKFNVEEETSETVNVKLTGVAGTVTEVKNHAYPGCLLVSTMQENGTVTSAPFALKGAYVNIAYNAETKVLTYQKVTGIGENGVPTYDTATVDLKTIVAGAFTGVTYVDPTETTAEGFKFTYKDETGAEQTQTVFETGVRKVEAGSTADKIKVTRSDYTGDYITTEILVGAGSVKNPTYDSNTRKITLPVLQADGTTQNVEINLGKDMVVTSGLYNVDTQEIELTLTDGSVVKIPAANLVDVYTGEIGSTVNVNVSDDNKISAEVRVAPNTEVFTNLLQADTAGLYVDESSFTKTNAAISNLNTKVGNLGEAADIPTYVDTKIAAAATEWVDFGATV